MASSTAIHQTTFITSVTHAASTPTSSIKQTATSIPQAPPAAYAWSADSNDGWSPAAIIGIVAAVVFLLISVPLIAVILRRYERKRLRETVNKSSSSGLGSSKSSVREGESLRNILVTRELQRTSLKLAEGMDKPEPVHIHGRGWSRTEVHGGNWK
ncbi:Nn.00g105320.m01.CDS01 [Neocucurbitaria sp. VM-36]